MGRAYKIQCKQCGAQFVYSPQSGYGVMPSCIGCGDSGANVSVIKCPGCQRKINTSAEDFSSQVIEETFWD